MKLLVRILIWLFPMLDASYRRHIPSKQKCPACGAVKNHRIAFVPDSGLVAVTCIVCGAVWGFEPMVSTGVWMKKAE